MAKTTRGLQRASALLMMPDAIERGMSRTAFYKKLVREGLGYRKQRVFADWRSVANIEAKKDVLKYVRKDRYPTVKEYAETEWAWNEEYAYKLKTRSRIRPGEPILERFSIIESDVPLTPAMMEQQLEERWKERAEDYPEELEKVIGVAAYRRVSGPLEED